MPSDPYSLLKVNRDASDLELKLAYERELKQAHKMDAFKHAQEIDAAYSILRDPHRREMFDSHGIADPSVRDSPLSRSGSSSSSAFSAIAASRALESRPKKSFSLARPSRKRLYVSLGVIGVAGLIGAGAYLQSNLSSGSPSTIAPYTPSGQIEMICRVGHGEPAVESTVASGQPVKCPTGVTPRFKKISAHSSANR